MKKLFILIAFGLMSLNTFATHIVGGEMTYRKLNGNNYKIGLTLFRDCFNGIPPFDNPAFITVFDVNGNVILTRQLTLLKDTAVSFTGIVSTCWADTNTCVSRGFYSDTLNLIPLTGGYTIAYQRCCRASTILNIANPGATGATYWVHIPGPEIVATNSSPLFTINPPFYVYINTLNLLDQSATDIDGDSLSYFFTNVFDGLDQCCPIIEAMPGCVGNTSPCPVVNIAPPYLSVNYLLPYSAVSPVSSITTMSIPTTGIISLTPDILGDYAVGVGINEYRNHNLIGTYYRDFHMKVVPCQTPTGVKELFDNELQVFPNPADRTITIKLSNSFNEAYYTLSDVSGLVVLRKKMESISENLDVSELSKGLYFLKIDSKNNKSGIIKKLIIE